MSRMKKCLFRVLTLVIAYGALELFSYCMLLSLAKEHSPLRSETTLFDAHRNHRLNPHFRFSKQPEAKIHSAAGFRHDGSVSRTKPPKTVRIVTLGTSALYGIGASHPYPQHRPLYNDETITHQLQQHLQRDGIQYRVEVINAGISAYRTYHHLMYLNADLLDYAPDIVINIDGHNDFYKTRLDDPWNTYAYSTSVLVDEFNRRTVFLPFFTVTRSLAPYSNTFNLLERLCRRIWHGKVARPLASIPIKEMSQSDDLETNVWTVAHRQYLLDLWQIHQLGRYAGYDHYVFLQPEVIFEDDDSLSQSDKQIKNITLAHLPPGHAEKMKKIRALLPGLFAKYEVPFFDVAELSPHNAFGENLYLDYCHLTPAGAKLTAERVATYLYPKVVEKIAMLEQAD